MQTNLRFDHLYADAEGQSHFAPFEVAVTLREFAPPAAPFSVSALDPASGCGFLHLPVARRAPSVADTHVDLCLGRGNGVQGDRWRSANNFTRLRVAT